MSLYAPLMSVELTHDYFPTPERLAVEIRPDRETADWLARAECVLRVVENRLQVIYDRQARGAPAADGEARELRFGALAIDPQFGEYTAGLSGPGRPAVIFGPGAKPDDDGVAPLEPLKDAPPWAGPRSDLVLALPLKGDLSDAGRRYRVRLKTRAAAWKYVLLDDWGDVTPCVVDARDGVAFAEAKVEALADGRRRLSIRSDKPLPITERCDRQFQLRARAGDGQPGPVLIGRLPGAAPGRLALDTSGGDLVTEIFVAR